MARPCRCEDTLRSFYAYSCWLWSRSVDETVNVEHFLPLSCSVFLTHPNKIYMIRNPSHRPYVGHTCQCQCLDLFYSLHSLFSTFKLGLQSRLDPGAAADPQVAAIVLTALQQGAGQSGTFTFGCDQYQDSTRALWQTS